MVAKITISDDNGKYGTEQDVKTILKSVDGPFNQDIVDSYSSFREDHELVYNWLPGEEDYLNCAVDILACSLGVDCGFRTRDSPLVASHIIG